MKVENEVENRGKTYLSKKERCRSFCTLKSHTRSHFLLSCSLFSLSFSLVFSLFFSLIGMFFLSLSLEKEDSKRETFKDGFSL